MATLSDCTKPCAGALRKHETRERVALGAREAMGKSKELRDTLNDVRSKLMEYGNILAEVLGEPSLLPQLHETE